MLYLQKACAIECGNNNNGGESVVLGTVDVKDSFFMVDQVTLVSLLGRTYKVKKNLQDRDLAPVLDIGHSVKHSAEFGLLWCTEQAYLARNQDC